MMEQWNSFSGMLKKAASGVLALLPCSHTVSTLRASKWLRPCPWKRASLRPWVWAGDKADIFDHSRRLLISIFHGALMGQVREIFNRPSITFFMTTLAGFIHKVCRQL